MVRIIPLGGMGKVTNNMFVYEYIDGTIEERLIVDCGIGFPEEEMLGADLLVPDISYLKGKEHTIVGLCLTHGHDDHIAGLPYVLPQLSADFPIFASKLTAGFAQSNFKEFASAMDVAFKKLDKQLHTITIDDVKGKMGYPKSWKNIVSL